MKINKILLMLAIAILVASSGCGGAKDLTVTSTPGNTQEPAPTSAIVPELLTVNLDAAIGSGLVKNTIPESADDGQAYFDIHPEYVEFDIQNYPLSDTSMTPRIYLFPVLRYRVLLPDIMPAREADLQSLLTGGPLGGQEMPFLPIFNSKQMFSAQVKQIEFQNGKGIRYITQYAQGIVPINNQEMFYTFQGLTDDNLYWVSVIFPIGNAMLPPDGRNPPDGKSMEDFAGDYLTYLSDTTAQLNQQREESFSPSIAVLDMIVESILVQP